jgi:hypothetical protein
MRKRFTSAAFVLLLGILSACSGDGSSPTEPTPGPGPGRTVSLNQPFDLRVGETVRLAGTDADVLLVRVHDDSRCPVDALCPATGSVGSQLQLRAGSRGPSSITASLLFDPGQGQQGAVIFHDLYRFTIEQVLPARQSNQEIAQSEYRVILVASLER